MELKSNQNQKTQIQNNKKSFKDSLIILNDKKIKTDYEGIKRYKILKHTKVVWIVINNC